jgi:hypothetical protein
MLDDWLFRLTRADKWMPARMRNKWVGASVAIVIFIVGGIYTGVNRWQRFGYTYGDVVFLPSIFFIGAAVTWWRAYRAGRGAPLGRV